MSAHEERERQGSEARAKEERTEQEREVEAQEGHESEVKAQEGHESEVKAQGEQEDDENSLHEESHVSNRHMTWWQNAWWVRVNNGPHMRTARDRRRVWRAATRAAGSARDGKGRRERKGEMGKTGGVERKRKQHVAHRIPLPYQHDPINPTAAAATAAATAATASPSRCIQGLALCCRISASLPFQGSPHCISSSTCETSLKVRGQSWKFPVVAVSTCYWVGSLFIFHPGCLPRCTVAGLVERGSSARSTRTEPFGVTCSVDSECIQAFSSQRRRL